MRKRIPVGGHAVGARHSAQRHNILIGAEVAHHAHAAHRQQNRESLPDLVVQTALADLLEVNRVGAAQNVERGFGHRAEHADPQTGTRKWVPSDDLLGQSELATDVAHLVLEKLTQRLDQLELHPRFESADIVVGLDRHGRTAPR